MALQFRGAYVRDGVKRGFATTSRVGEQRNREKERGPNVRDCPNEKDFIKNRCRHPGPHFRFVSWPTSNFYDASRQSTILVMKTLFYSNFVKWTDFQSSLLDICYIYWIISIRTRKLYMYCFDILVLP